MNSTLLQIAAKQIRPIMIIVSFFVLMRGHNLPGGGFIGGLLAGAGISFYAIAFSVPRVISKLLDQVRYLSAFGLLLAIISTLPGVFAGSEFMHAEWIKIPLPIIDYYKIGTPVLFDVGVYFTVIGVMVSIILNLMEEWSWK